MTDNDTRTTKVYLVLERANWQWDPPRVVAMRKEKPQLKSGQVAVRVQLKIPMSLFDTFIPVVEAELDEQDFILPTVEVEQQES